MINIKRILKHRLRLRKAKIDVIKKNKLKIKSVKSNKNIIIYLFEAAHFQSLHMIHFGILLEARGHNVYFVFCAKNNSLCEIKTYKNNNKFTCINCNFTREKFKKHFGIKIIELPELIELDEDGEGNKNSDFTVSVNDTATRFYMGDTLKSKVDIKLKETLNKVEKNLVTFCRKLDLEYAPDLVIANMTDYVYFTPIIEYFKASNRFMQISPSSFDINRVYIDVFELYPAASAFKKYLAKNNSLNKNEEQEVHDYMLKRFGDCQPHSILFKYQNKHIDDIKKQLKYDHQKRNIFLFPNVHWDIGQSTQNSLFTDLIEWVGQTCNIVAKHENIKLYIKPHPAEDFDKHKGEQGIIGAVKAKGFEIPKNVFIIDNKWGIKPYDIFPLIDLAVVSSGTLGLESLYKKVECINVGIAAYGNTELDRCPENVAQYKDLLIDGDKHPTPSRSLVMSFLYFYFIHRQIKWPLSTKYNNDETFSVSELKGHNILQINKFFRNIEKRLNARKA